MMSHKHRAAIVVVATALCLATTTSSGGDNIVKLESDLRATEIAFAQTMADRDLDAFATFVAQEAIFSGLRGKSAVVDGWASFFDGPNAPFSWTPEHVVVLSSGTLGTSSGPVFDPNGKRIGTFNSVWRLQANGRWQVVFDRGCPPCDCP